MLIEIDAGRVHRSNLIALNWKTGASVAVIAGEAAVFMRRRPVAATYSDHCPAPDGMDYEVSSRLSRLGLFHGRWDQMEES